MRIKLGIVAPCYNEEQHLPETVNRPPALLPSSAADGLAAIDSSVHVSIDTDLWHDSDVNRGLVEHHEATI
jgi:hypothetical protein